MAKHPTSRRVHRDKHDDDAFVAAALESSVWARDHSRTLIITIVSVLVILGGLLYYKNFQASKNNRAEGELTQVRQTVLQGNRQLSMRDLNNFVNKYGNAPAADEARLMLAQLYIEDGKGAKAVETVKSLGDKPGKNASAALLLGAAYEANKQLDKAEEVYLDVADNARFGFEKREGLERAAGIRLTKGNTAGAAELYDRAMKTLPEDSPERTVYEMRVAEVRAAGAKTGS
jgi:predicted negative regulator of RcsB-dependent stress response